MPCGSRISRSTVAERRRAHAERRQVELRRILVEQAQHDALAGPGRQRRDAHVDLLVAELQRDAAVLRQPLLGDVEARHDLDARDQRRVQRARRLDHVAQHAVDAEAHDRARLVRLEVHVGGALAQRLQQQRVDHPDHRRLRAAVEQVLGRRQVLHQPREVGLAREILAHLRARRRRRCRRARARSRSAPRRPRASRSGRCSTRFSSAMPSTRRVGARQHDDAPRSSRQREHAVRPRERVGDPRARAAARRRGRDAWPSRCRAPRLRLPARRRRGARLAGGHAAVVAEQRRRRVGAGRARQHALGRQRGLRRVVPEQPRALASAAPARPSGTRSAPT